MVRRLVRSEGRVTVAEWLDMNFPCCLHVTLKAEIRSLNEEKKVTE